MLIIIFEGKMNFRFEHNLKLKISNTMTEIAIPQGINVLTNNKNNAKTSGGNWLDRLFDEDARMAPKGDESTKIVNKNSQNQKEVSKYYTWPEMLEMLRNRTAWIKIENQWTHVKFQINGGKLQMLLL